MISASEMDTGDADAVKAIDTWLSHEKRTQYKYRLSTHRR